ncbi:hypothetical protein CBS101457_000350 [Exobasidium rhododendri]|nr:hypothetical protein CBS101457_000350 [Exobasidium rhododendri]
MTAAQKLVLYVDIVSPWTYVAYTVLQRYKKPWNLDLQIKPINLGYVMKFSGNRPPISVQNKGMWMDEDMKRASIFYGVPLNRPADFPANTFFAQSVLRLISLESPSNFDLALQAMFEAVWHERTPIQSAEDIKAVLQKKGIKLSDSDLTTLIERGISKEERNKLSEETKVLVEEGCFGMPWMVATRQDGSTSRWFGSDRFEQLASWLGQEYKGPFANGHIAKL